MQSYTLIIAFILFSSYAQAQEQTKYINKKGRFKIGFLKSPAMTKKLFTSVRNRYHVDGKDTILVYNFRTTTYVSKSLNNNNLKYEIGYFDVPNTFSDTLTKNQIYSLFDGMQQIITMRDGTQHTYAQDATFLGSQNFKLLGYIGREYSWQQQKDEILFRTRLYWVKNRVYVISIRTAKKNNFNNDINKFFDSFELLNTPKNPKAEIETETSNALEAQNFTIDFPSIPEINEAETTSAELGTAKMTVYAFQPKSVSNDNNIAYIVLVMKCQKDITKSKDFNLEDYYDKSAEKSANGRQATVISKKMIKIKGRDAIESRESFRNGQIIIKQRIILKNNNMYFICVMVTPENDENKEMNNFLDSFSLKEY